MPQKQPPSKTASPTPALSPPTSILAAAHFSLLSGSNVIATPFMQNRSPVGAGPSGNTWPRWPPQLAQCTSVRRAKKLSSIDVATASSSGLKKLGQPVPLSNFVLDAN